MSLLAATRGKTALIVRTSALQRPTTLAVVSPFPLVRNYASASDQKPKTNQQERAIRISQQEMRRKRQQERSGIDDDSAATFGSHSDGRQRQRPPPHLGFERERESVGTYSRNQYRPHHGQESLRDQRFELSRCLSQVAQQEKRRQLSPAQALEQVEELLANTPERVTRDVIIYNQHIRSLLRASKFNQALDTYQEMKRLGLTPSGATFHAVFSQAANPRSVTSDNTALIQRLKAVHEDYEQWRQEVMLADKQSKDLHGQGTSFDRRPTSSKASSRHSDGNVVAAVTAYWLHFLSSIGEREEAWDLLNRFNTTSHDTAPDGYPPLSDIATRTWQDSLINGRLDGRLTDKDCDRLKEHWKTRTAFLYSAGKEILREWSFANRQQKESLETTWAYLKPSRSSLLQLTKLAISSQNVELCDMTLEVVRDFSDLGILPSTRAQGQDDLPSEMRQPDHPLYAVVTWPSAVYDRVAGHERWNNVSMANIYAALSRVGDWRSISQDSTIIFDQYMAIAEATLVQLRERRRAQLTHPGEQADVPTDMTPARFVAEEDFGKEHIFKHEQLFIGVMSDSASGDDSALVEQRLKRALAVRRELARAGAIAVPPTNRAYQTAMIALRKLGNSEAFDQVAHWWLEDRHQVHMQALMPWCSVTVSNGLHYAATVLDTVNRTMGQLRSQLQGEGSADNAVGPQSAMSAAAQEQQGSNEAAEQSEGAHAAEADSSTADGTPADVEELSPQERQEIADAVSRLHKGKFSPKIDDGDLAEEEGDAALQRHQAKVNDEALLKGRDAALRFLRAWRHSFQHVLPPGEAGAEGAAVFQRRAGPSSSSTTTTTTTPVPPKRSRTVLDADFVPFPSQSDVAYLAELPPDRSAKFTLTERQTDLHALVLVFAKLLRIALESGARSGRLLPAEETRWLKALRARVLELKEEIAERGWYYNEGALRRIAGYNPEVDLELSAVAREKDAARRKREEEKAGAAGGGEAAGGSGGAGDASEAEAGKEDTDADKAADKGAEEAKVEEAKKAEAATTTTTTTTA